MNPHEPDAKITRMKTGGTRLAHKHEHAVDMDTGAIVGMSLNGGTDGDTKTIEETTADAAEKLDQVRDEVDDDTAKRMAEHIEELTADKGYHSNGVLTGFGESEIRTYISEPKRGQRRWDEREAERDAVYGNRRRVQGNKGKALLRRRGELLERAMAHLFDSGGMRRIHLRRHDNIMKRLVIHAAGFNLSLIMRTLFGVGKPRVLQGHSDLAEALMAMLGWLHSLYMDLCALTWAQHARSDASQYSAAQIRWSSPQLVPTTRASLRAAFTTGC